MLLNYVFLVTFLIGTVSCQIHSDGDVIDSVSKSLTPEQNETIHETLGKSKMELKKRCDQNGGSGAYDRAEAAMDNLMTCVSSYVDLKKLQTEIEDAKPTGTVDEVFKKYCDKSPELKNCALEMAHSIEPCFTANEVKNLKTVYNVTEKLIDFTCFKEGDRIALFIAEGGQECFTEKQEELKQCANYTMDVDGELNPDDLSKMTLSFDEKQCMKLSQLQNCFVTTLETCPKPTSSNIVESMFNFIWKATPCKQFSPKGKNNESQASLNAKTAGSKVKSGASTVFVTSATVTMAIAAILLH